jgi:hypothetical protein
MTQKNEKIKYIDRQLFDQINLNKKLNLHVIDFKNSF